MGRRFIPSPLFMYLFKHLFISAWTRLYFCSTLGNNQILDYFVAHIVPALDTGSSFRLAPVLL